MLQQNNSILFLHVYIYPSLEQVWHGAAIYQQSESGSCQGTSVQEQNTQICIAGKSKTTCRLGQGVDRQWIDIVIYVCTSHVSLLKDQPCLGLRVVKTPLM